MPILEIRGSFYDVPLEKTIQSGPKDNPVYYLLPGYKPTPEQEVIYRDKWIHKGDIT